MSIFRSLATVLVLLIGMWSFKLADIETYDFSYPKRKNAAITINGKDFKKFSKEWRSQDYYYYGETKDGLICSVLFYKLNKDEQKLMVEPLGGMLSAAIPYIYFSQNSKLKQWEKNEASWGSMEDEFMFRQNDILEFQGRKINQKHMYAYGMLDKDLFINIHLSKVNFTPADSTVMREILSSVQKKK